MVKSIEQLRKQALDDREHRKNMPGKGHYKRSPEQFEKTRQTQLRNVAEGKNNRSIKKQCIYCGEIQQQYMIDRWHNENCHTQKEKRESTWLYVSPKLRGLKVNT